MLFLLVLIYLGNPTPYKLPINFISYLMLMFHPHYLHSIFCLPFISTSVQVQTDNKRPRTAGQPGPASQLMQNNKPKKPADEQFERTTK